MNKAHDSFLIHVTLTVANGGLMHIANHVIRSHYASLLITHWFSIRKLLVNGLTFGET